MLGRTLLPVFGGSAAVWSVCLAAYQVLLLAGYAYAYGMAKHSWRTQRCAHLSLLVAATLWALGIAASRSFLKGFFGTFPVPSLEVLFCVLVFVGLPYVLLASGSTLVQVWLARENAAGSPQKVYRLYAVSNLGSLLGLLIYPFVMEPFVPLAVQWWGFAVCFAGYAAFVTGLMTCIRLPGGSAPSELSATTDTSAPRNELWLLLPGVSAFLLNAVIAHLFTDVTPMPLVWVAMLSVFLLSYVIGFSRLAEVRRGVWRGLAALALLGVAIANGMWGTGSFYPNAAAAAAMLFFVGVVLHGWLYAERPDASRLTRYYLAIAAGGAAGGLLSSLVVPVISTRVWEYPLILGVCAVLVAWRSPKPKIVASSPFGRWTFPVCCGIAWLILAGVFARQTTSQTIFRDRNFYGCLRVTQTFEPFGQYGTFPVNYLWCGQTTHGIQVRSPLFKGRGTSYYGQTGGGIVFSAHPKRRSGQGLKVGIVGLGAGCLACYGRPGDLFRFYEINPHVVKVATDPKLFTYLRDAPMPIDLVTGDARRMLENERKAGDPLYDVLVIDAYSGDAVPYHLATVEAFRLYLDRLAPDGILAVHVSNWHIDMLPLCKAVAEAVHLCPYGVVGISENSVTTSAIWVFMTRLPMEYRFPGKPSVREVVWENIRPVAAPTDAKGSLLPLLRF